MSLEKNNVLKKGENGKFKLVNAKGEVVYFNYSADAREALMSTDIETGERMFFMPGTVVKKEIETVSVDTQEKPKKFAMGRPKKEESEGDE